MSSQRIYLDNAATSWPKPPAVVAAILDFYQNHGSAAGRGAAGAAMDSGRSVSRVRAKSARLIGADDPDHVVFTFNGTDALNMAIFGVLRQGDHVITTVLEHNSVLRPLKHWERSGKIELTVVGIDSDGYVDLQELNNSIRPETRLICVSHVSNVLGTVQPVKEIAEMKKPDDCLVLIDAAQSVGHLPIDVKDLGCDLLAASGHKGLLGPLGTGFLYLAERVAGCVEPFRLGGTGSQSESETQPTVLPDRLEAGNLNVGGLLGLEQGIEFVANRTVGKIGADLDELCQMFREGVAGIKAVRLYPHEVSRPTHLESLVSFSLAGAQVQETASILDTAFGIQVRAGLHCASLVHAATGTAEQGGTIRFSPGCFSTIDDVDAIVDALKQIASA